MKFIANFFSYAFHPIFYYFYIYLIYWWLDPYANHSVDSSGLLLAKGVVFFNTALLPIAIILFSKRSLLSGNLSDRRFSVIMTALIYVVTYFTFARSILPNIMIQILWANVAGLSLAYIANYFAKISLHASGAGGLVAVFVYFYLDYASETYFQLLLISLLIAGAVGSSRLFLKVHTNKELYLGYLGGFVVTFLVLLS